jgi:hypothetical protein
MGRVIIGAMMGDRLSHDLGHEARLARIVGVLRHSVNRVNEGHNSRRNHSFSYEIVKDVQEASMAYEVASVMHHQKWQRTVRVSSRVIPVDRAQVPERIRIDR